MSNPHVIYNGVSSEELGLIVTRLPDLHRAARNVTEVTVPGRGQLVQDGGDYDLYTAVLEVNTNGQSLRTVYGWLRGEGWMISSDDPDYKAYVYCYNQIDDERFRTADGPFDTLSIDLRVEPFRRLVNEAGMSFAEPAVFPGQGDERSLPLIGVQGGGNINLMVNGATVYLDGLSGEIFIDCEAGVAYTLDAVSGEPVFAGTIVTLEEGRWPYLLPEGEYNAVNWTGSVIGVTLQPNWRWL